MLTIRLEQLLTSRVTGIYTVNGVPGRLPDRMRLLHPDAARMFRAIEDWVVVSDMFRSPESSLAAVRAKRGAQPPGFSAHNYGLAIDLDLDASAKRLAALVKCKTISKSDLDEAMASAGWFCHRLDEHDFDDFEAWHFQGLSIHARPAGNRSSDEVEARILELYGRDLAPEDRECQASLRQLGMYHGALDGDIGPLTREATRAFQRAWGVVETGKLDARTRRTLAYVSCGRTVAMQVTA
jgi:hypothetical protein